MARPEKEAAVADIARRFDEADAALLTEYRGLRVSEIADVRNALREVGSDYKVLKNTLALIAAKKSGFDELETLLEGPTAIAFVTGDVAQAAKALDEAAKRFPVLVIKGGVLNGKILGADDARLLAKLEPREVLLAKIAGLMNQPAQKAVNVFAALLRDLGSMLAQVVEQKGSDAPAPAAEEEQSPAEPPEATDEVPAPEADVEAQTAEVEAAAESEPAPAEETGDATEIESAEQETKEEGNEAQEEDQ